MNTSLQTCLAILLLSIFSTPALGIEMSSEADEAIPSLSSEDVISFNSTSGLNPVQTESIKSESEYMIDLLSKTNNLSLDSNISSRSELNTKREISGAYSTTITLIDF